MITILLLLLRNNHETDGEEAWAGDRVLLIWRLNTPIGTQSDDYHYAIYATAGSGETSGLKYTSQPDLVQSR